MTTLTFDTTVARQIATDGRAHSARLLRHIDALTSTGLRRQALAGSRDLLEVGLFLGELNRRGYRTVSDVGRGYVTKLVDYLSMPAELTAALTRREYAPNRPRSEWGTVNYGTVCWAVAQWAQTATASEVTCLAALLTECVTRPVDQLLATATLVAA